MKYEFAKHDQIWLQKSEYPEITWCQYKIYDDDVEYLLATPERKAASDVLKILKDFVEPYKGLHLHANGFRTCPYCFITLKSTEEFRHAPECEIVLARTLIKSIEEEEDESN